MNTGAGVTTRRGLLRGAVGLGCLALLAGPAVGSRIGRAQAETPPQTKAYRWRGAAGLRAQAEPDGTSGDAYLSEAYEAPGVFSAIGSLWSGTVETLEVRASADGINWSDWFEVSRPDTLEQARDGRTAGLLVTGSGWGHAQYRVQTASAGPDVELVLIDSSEGPKVTGPLAAASGEMRAAVAQPSIISRAGWGCDESLGYKNGEDLWPPEYRTVQKVIVHHTAGSNDYSDGAAQVRAVYSWHAVGQGWGDIGYNYLVDRSGNIYEGRRGGENVVGGHALQYNWGSSGIACLGTFSSATPPQAMKDGLARIVAWAGRYLDPHGQSWFVDGTYANICGHCDVMSTECPGANLYAYLPALRDAVQGLLNAPEPKPAARIDGVSFTPVRLPPGAALRVEVTVTNVGGGTMQTQGPSPEYTYYEGQDYRTQGFSEVTGAFRVAVGFEGEPPGPDHPYRFGLPGPLGPGQTTKVVGYVVMRDLQQRSFWAGVVQEGVQWWNAQAGTTQIKVVPSYCFASGASAAAAGTPTAVTEASSVTAASTGTNRVYLPLVSSLPPCD